MKNPTHAIRSLLALIVLVGASCGGGSSTTSGYTYYDPYYYYSYYPADVYYSGYYWTDPYTVYYFATTGTQTGAFVDGGTSDAGTPDAAVSDASVTDGSSVTDAHAGSDGGGSGGSGNISGFLTVGDAIRALALGQQVCPNQVTVTPSTGPNVCGASGGPATVRNGVMIQFNGCMLSDGGRLDGTYEVQATRTPSDPSCGPGTTVSIAITTTVTSLTYAGPGGRKLIIPNLAGSSTITFAVGQPPTSTALNLNGHMQIQAANGTMLLDNVFNGQATVTPQDKTAYSLDGVLTLQDQLVSGATSTVTTQGLTRTTDCCRPSAGTVTVARTRANNAGTHTWTFGPTCGAVKFDNTNITLPAACL
jgi:hypothetical protein